MIFDNKKKISEDISMYAGVASSSIVAAVLMIFLLMYIAFKVIEIISKNSIELGVLEIIIIVFILNVSILLFDSKTMMEKKYLFVRCDPYTYYEIARRRKIKRNDSYNLKTQIYFDFYTGKFNDCIENAIEFIDSYKVKPKITRSIHHLLCLSLFLTDRYEECLKHITKIKAYKNWDKDLVMTMDFTFLDKCINNQYYEAICELNEIPRKAQDLEKARIYYILAQTVKKVSDELAFLV